MKMNRKRSALCLSAFLLCSLITGCAVNQGNNAVPPPSPQTADADVIVVGAGPAGMSAALSAVENGAEKVILLERRNTTGGTMTNTSGSMSGADTIIQQLDGYTEDSPELYYEDIAHFALNNSGRPNLDIIWLYANESKNVVNWLWENGLNDNEYTTMPDGKKTVFAPEHDLYNYPRTYKPLPDNPEKYRAAIHEVMDEMLARTPEIEIRLNTQGMKLIPNENGHILGLEVQDLTSGETTTLQAARGIIMATGDFAGNPKLISYYKEDLDSVLTAGLKECDGNGLRMLQEVGATLTYNMDRMATLAVGLENPLAPGTGRIMDTKAMYAGGINVNQNGERFVDETHRQQVVRERALDAQPGNVMYEIFTDKIRDDLLTTIHAPMMQVFFMSDAGKSYVIEADSIEELAGKINVPADTLKKTIEDYNAHVDSKEPDEFGREFVLNDNLYNAAINKVEGDKYYCVPIKSLLIATSGGIKPNVMMQPMDKFGTAIPGVFVAGAVSSFWGGGAMSGTAILGASFMGREAGKNAMTIDYIESYKVQPADDSIPAEYFTADSSPTAVQRYDMEKTFKDGTYEATVDGQDGPMTVEVIIQEGKINAVTVKDHKETVTVGGPALETLPAAIVEANSINIDAISGATLSSERLFQAVAACLDEASQ
mgnify:FL=1